MTSKSFRRIVVPLFVIGIAFGILLVVIKGRGAPSSGRSTPATATQDETPDGADPSAAGETTAPDGTTEVVEAPPPEDVELAELAELIAFPPGGGIAEGQSLEPLGSFDFTVDRMKVEMAPTGAGIARITFNDYWITAAAKRKADRIEAGIEAGTMTLDDLPGDQRYVLDETAQLGDFDVPTLAMHSVKVNGVTVMLFGDVWDNTGPGAFATEIRDGDGTPLLRITRTFIVGGHGYDLTVEQRVENVSDQPLSVQWAQYGPGDLTVDRARYMDRRRFRFGWLWDVPGFPPDMVQSKNNDLIFERNTVHKRQGKATAAFGNDDPVRGREELMLWPNETSHEESFILSWFASTNRYFALAVHPVLDADGQGDLSLVGSVDEILLQSTASDLKDTTIFTFLYSPERIVPAGETVAFDMGVYAGPLDRHILKEKQPYVALHMGGLILYQMSNFCAICTFQWLAVFLLNFLSLLHNYVLFDWGLAIIGLVIVVRTLLHPITKRSQVNMQRFGRKMSELKPEIEKLQKKYGEEPRRMQQEQMRLMREHGLNPLQMLGCLPMFLQMPIWVALYATLYFAIDIRHQPAFFGLFQKIGGWPFLGDLSSSDHFFGELAEPTRFFMWNITGINLLPLLMGVVFFVQQKYMSPPPSPSMTPEQAQQQKIMKILMVVMFPLMLYSAPSGLTLYILTSSCIGVLESKYIRQHVTDMDLNPPKKKKPPKKKPKDAQGRAYAAALERAKSARKSKKSFKKRR